MLRLIKKAKIGNFLPLLFPLVLLLTFMGCVGYPNIPKIEDAKFYTNPEPGWLKNYLISPNDVLNIVVWDHEDLTRDVQVSAEGGFSYPLIGRVKAAGLTVSQLEEEIARRLSGRYIINPQVTVTVKEYHRFFYVFGQVKKPGRYPLEADTTVLKAITTAGGVTDKAAINKTKIVREEKGVRREIRVKMTDLVRPEDVIIVPESFF